MSTQTKARPHVDPGLMDKLAKIRALAEDARDEAEGFAAMLAFQRLLAKHNLNADELRFEDEEPEVIREETQVLQRVPTWLRAFHCVIAQHFRCISYMERRHGATTMFFVGMEDDARIAREALECAIAVGLGLWEEQAPYLSDGTVQAKNAYLQAFATGMSDAFAEQERQECLGLILVRDPRVEESLDPNRQRRKVKLDIPFCRSAEAGYWDGHNHGRGDALPGQSFTRLAEVQA